MKCRFYFLFYIIVLLQFKTLGISIDDFGAIESDKSIEVALKNSEAIQNAFKAINQLENGERVVTIPDGKTYYFFPTLIQNTQNFTFQIDGKLIVPDNSIDVYPKIESGYQHALIIQNCSSFKITGYGSIDGQGYDWWWATLTTKVVNDRPHLIYIEQSQDFIIENIRVRNSPFYHIVLYDATNIVIRGIDIKVDVKGQQDLISKYKQMKNEKTSFIDKVIN